MHNGVEYPEAYRTAVRNAIHGRASAKRRREWDAAHPVLAAWLDWYGYTYIPLTDASSYQKHPLGCCPAARW